MCKLIHPFAQPNEHMSNQRERDCNHVCNILFE